MVQAVGLQTYIWNNNLRSTLLLIGFPLLLIGMIYVLQLGLMGAGYLPSTGSLNGDLGYSLRLLIGSAPLALVVAGVWFVIAYFSNQLIINLATGAQPVTRKDEPELYNLLENLCISRGMRTPTLQIIETDALNAFASGLYIHHNKLNFLPTWITEMDSIQRLGISHNHLLELPDLSKMTSLEELDFEVNEISVFPWKLLEMPNLNVLIVRDNPFVLTKEEREALDCVTRPQLIY